ncbi:hypothetical protein LTR62_003662 [Meristemomyces frigidus]|uniref:WD40 repeat-like protein n=1 Tax=Meristemomyces frigidus TaxID=1508187 RepID=A0AAN7YGN4_9PEZI|nr:hypothetical protein LTR62_003662 [Meristemomyces frigidus]
MARMNEPTFCPNEISFLLPVYSWNFQDASANTTLPTPELTEDEDEDDVGGVALPTDLEDTSVTPSVHRSIYRPAPAATLDLPAHEQTDTLLGSRYATSITEVQRPRRLNFHSLTSQQTASEGSAFQSQPLVRTVLAPSHPRPHSQELWDEEDSRRLRFALEGSDVDEVPRFLNTTNMHLSQQSYNSATVAPQPIGIYGGPEPRSNMHYMLNMLDRALVQHQAQTSSEYPAGGRTREATDQAQITDIAQHDPVEDDWLAVDDPRREYDFAEFMDYWRLRAVIDRRIIPHIADVQPPKPISPLPGHLNRHDLAPKKVDVQGINWDLVGLKRHHVTAARAQLHPSQRNASNYTLTAPSSHDPDQASAYRFRGFTPQHRAQTSHYQLRNMVAATMASDIFYSTGSKVIRTSLGCPSSSEDIMDLSTPIFGTANFRITCLATSPPGYTDNFVIAGGFNGEYAVQNLNNDIEAAPCEGYVTHAYNGLVTHVHTFNERRSGRSQAAFCSNDYQLRILDVETLRMTGSFMYSSSINCAAMAPDGRLRAIVGDCKDVYITDAERGDTLVTLNGHSDHGFACAWSHDGIHVATGAQDRQTLVWDARNWSRPLRHLPSVISCPRSLHFADDGSLVVAESDDVVSIYESNTFRKRQDLRFFGSVAGVALLNGGEQIVVANTDKTVGGLLSFERSLQSMYLESRGAQIPRASGRGRELTRSRRSHGICDVII